MVNRTLGGGGFKKVGLEDRDDLEEESDRKLYANENIRASGVVELKEDSE